ncbi:hypothetical protein [Anaerotruncus rubiinfantis]|uniref:hypothetical protein n=1 Tax=Anaerotruncus rubiinfantis TaxID=1720200 RepID=UPI003D79065A
MTELTNELAGIIRQDFEQDFALIVEQMPKPPADATPEEIMRRFGVICHWLAFMKGLSVGTDLSKVYL